MKKLIKKKGILFWVTGLSNSGKSTIAKKITPTINKTFGPSVFISGDDLRNFFNIKGYTRQERLKIGYNYSNFIKFITDQGINVVFAVIGLFDQVRNYNKKNIKNYIEIYIKTDIKNIIKFSKKKHYINNNKFIWGIDLKPEFPKKPNIVIKNDFNKSTDKLAKELLSKIKNLNL
jgi:adenylylsulfate kinase|tara:strand:+ start:2211 stop:2735 length:525 start_codon:yes stop_codon:yes gene_type:complete